MAEATCSVNECDGITGVPGTAKGLCSKHYNRWRRYGDVTVVNRRPGPGKGTAHHFWKGADASYTALHNRVYRTRGKADHCEQCGLSGPGRRYEWAMKHGTDGTEVMDYVSLCRPCHRHYDLGRLTLEQRQEIRERYAAGESQVALAREFGIDKSVISRGLSTDVPKWQTELPA